MRFVHELQSAIEELFIHSFHSLGVQRSSVLDLLLADLAKHAINRRVIGSRRPTVKDAARAELLFEFRILGIVRILRLLFRVKVIEIAEELVEAVSSRQEFVAIAQVIFTKLTANVAHRFEQFRDGWILRLESKPPPRKADFVHATPVWRL